MWLKSFVWSMLLQVCTILIFRLFYSHSDFWFQNFGFVKLLGKICCPSTQQIVTRFVWRLVHTSESRRRNFVLISEAQNVCANFFGSHAFSMTPKTCLSWEIRLSSSSKSFSIMNRHVWKTWAVQVWCSVASSANQPQSSQLRQAAHRELFCRLVRKLNSTESS